MRSMVAIGFALLLWAGSASAQISCPAGCTTTTYGLGHPDDVDFRRSPSNAFAYDDIDFQGSYFYLRSNPANPAGIDCGIDRDYTPIQGRVLIKEQNGCVPTSTGPACTAGTQVGAVCHLPLGSTSAANTTECGTGGTCTLVPGGCPVEIPLTNNTTPFAQRSEIMAPIWAKSPSGVGGLLDLLSSGAFALSGSSSSNPADNCLASFIRTVPSQGQRYLLPASRGGNPTDPNPAARRTFIRWNEDPTGASALYRHNDDGVVCCNSTTTLCGAVGPFLRYPVLNRNNCRVANANNPGIALFLQTPDWLFDGGAGTPFEMDPEFAVPGQIGGVCRVNRDRGCTVPGGPATLGIDCATLGDIDPNTPGVQLDTCDFREPGIRTTRPGTLPNNYPLTDRCANSHYVLRGTPNANCHITDRYIEDGDPGPDCDVVNFGVRTRPDFDCDGVADSTDLCPLLNEFDHLADSDNDCDISPAACRGDECECGDQSLDGQVSVGDLVAINSAIFNPLTAQELCDTNLDDRCNVSDILGANREIFVPGTAFCSHVTTLNCGDGFLDPNEECDDGNRFAGDGCNPICRDE